MYSKIPRHPKHQYVVERQQFIAQHTNGKEKLEFVFFWGGHYSQWAASPFYHDGNYFPTAEHFMMYHKCMAFKDTQRAQMVLDLEGPDQVKAVGRQIEAYTDAVWDAIRFDIVVMGNVLKFSQNPDFFEVMRNDCEKCIVEASPYDRIWGIGRSETDPNLDDVDEWDGLNLLGYAIMEARERLLGLPKL